MTATGHRCKIRIEVLALGNRIGTGLAPAARGRACAPAWQAVEQADERTRSPTGAVADADMHDHAEMKELSGHDVRLVAGERSGKLERKPWALAY